MKSQLKLFGKVAATLILICLVSLPNASHSALAGYRMEGEPIQISDGFRVNLTKVPLNGERLPWEGEAARLTLDASFQSNYRLRVKIYNETERFEVPLTINPATGGNQNPLYDIQFNNGPMFSFKVIRKATGAVLFDSGIPQEDFIFADQYLTLSWKPASENVYGIGENEQPTFRHDFSRNLTWGLWSKDQPPGFTANMYGVHPYYTVLENDGNAHSVVIVNSNAQQFSMLSGPTIKYTTIGGILDFYFFLGPTPENTVEQYTEAIGRAPLPPYWALGFQLSRFGYDNMENLQRVVNRTIENQIPYDVQYADIDVMHKNLDFTYSRERFPGLPEYVKELKAKGINFIPIVDPAISSGENPEEYRALKLGNEMDVWMKRQDGSNVMGHVWPEHDVYFPDFTKNATREWWITLLREYHDLLEYDGIWIDMNEPANMGDGDVQQGCAENNINFPPFVPQIQGEKLSASTLCADHVHEKGLHYDLHSMYGWFESEATLAGARAGTGRRSFIVSRSTFIGSGKWAAHWLGDNFSQWSNMHTSIIGMLQFNHFGIPYNGADICGFLQDTQYEMCLRWMQLGAFYPFARNHNVAGAPDQDPGSFDEKFAEISRDALNIRYTLLPYLYTLFYKHVTQGSTVVRALWHEFPQDSNTWGIDTQFMWGSGLIISPVMETGATSVSAYLPGNGERFYQFSNGMEVSVPGSFLNVSAPLETIPIHIRGGHVLPMQGAAQNTKFSRMNAFGVIIALDMNGEASGELFYDDGDSIDTIPNGQYFLQKYTVKNNTLIVETVNNGYDDIGTRTMNNIRLMGVPEKVTEVRINGNDPHFNYFNTPLGEVDIVELYLVMNTNYTISWSF